MAVNHEDDEERGARLNLLPHFEHTLVIFIKRRNDQAVVILPAWQLDSSFHFCISVQVFGDRFALRTHAHGEGLMVKLSGEGLLMETAADGDTFNDGFFYHYPLG